MGNPTLSIYPRLPAYLLLLVCGCLAAPSFAQPRPESLADLLPAEALTNPARRAEVAQNMRRFEEERKAAAVERAEALGLPVRVQGPGNQVAELIAFEDDRPTYAVTYNANAAITTAADAVRNDFGLDGANFTVGVWDAGAIRPTHEAFAGRVTVRDGASNESHSTHVGGTIGAAGPNADSRGMTPAVFIDSYDWNSDKSEMTSRGASHPGEAGMLYISNHSYGYRSGWGWTGQWEWFGPGNNQDAIETNFGRYNNQARDMDSLVRSLPYYLVFWPAGNDRSNNPAQGSTVKIGTSTVTYDSASHPPGDGKYKSGFDTIGFESLAKNVMSIGAVNDAVDSLKERDLSRAWMTSFSSWGPTDDGRIKPDVVANGASVFSTQAGSDSSYGTTSGTSMASPNAAGSAQLLVSTFDQLFPGHVLRASTLKGLILHTADDLGRPGPDYQFGWGLMNAGAAAEQIADHHASPGSHRIVEAEIPSDDAWPGFHSYTFTWDGVSPIRATLSWTDPAGQATTNGDDRTRRLVNNLNLELQDPNGGIHQPYTMPYVGDWSREALSADAVPGINNTDNVEQVFIATPPIAGEYTAIVTVDETLSNAQNYGLIISGSADESAPLPEVTFISPESASSSVTTMTLVGDNFQTGANVSLTFPDQPDRKAYSQEVTPERIKARIETDDMAGGTWNVVVTNPDGQQFELPASFAVAAPFWSEAFEDGATDWSSSADSGATAWHLTETASRSPSHSYQAPGKTEKDIDSLRSPVIEIPADVSDLAFSFWHSYDLQGGEGGVIEFSLDGGKWFDPTSSGSGVSFVSGAYNSSVTGKGKPSDRNPLGSRSAWAGSKADFSEVVMNLSSSKFAGTTMRVRWQLGSTDSGVSPGWFIDDIAIQGAGSTTFATPQITAAPSASESPVTGTAVGLSVEAENSDGTDDLIYTWTVNDSFDFPISFDDNGTHTADFTTATFSRAGSYRFKVTVRNGANQSTSSEFDLDVLQTPASVKVEPASASVPVGGEHDFGAQALDQFQNPLEEQSPPSWSIDPAAGAVSTEGLFTAGEDTGGPFPLTASFEGGLSGHADVTVRDPNFADWQETYFTAEELSDPGFSAETADPDGDGAANLLEYALGGDPLRTERNLLPKISLETSGEEAGLLFTFSRPADISDLTYRVEASGDFLDWALVPEDTWQLEPDGDNERITIREAVSDSPRRFLRLEVEKAP